MAQGTKLPNTVADGREAPEAASLTLAGEPQEEIPCPLCGADAPVRELVVRDILMWRPGDYHIVRCSECGMRYLSPRPTLAALGAHYPDDYLIYRKLEDYPPWVRPIIARYADGQWKRALRRIEMVVGQLTPETKLVDMGCGMNHLLATAKQLRGCEGIGVDFKESAVRYVRDVRGMPCILGGLHDGHFADAQFDLVIMNEYLEHEPNPRGVLREARRITKPGGHISIEAPFTDNMAFRLFGASWTQIDAPRHLMHFTRQTLKAMIEGAGYEVVHVKPFHIPFMIGLSASQRLGVKHVGGPNLLQMALACVLALPFYAAYPWMDELVHVVARAV